MSQKNVCVFLTNRKWLSELSEFDRCPPGRQSLGFRLADEYIDAWQLLPITTDMPNENLNLNVNYRFVYK
jgi:hypothetical protein